MRSGLPNRESNEGSGVRPEREVAPPPVVVSGRAAVLLAALPAPPSAGAVPRRAATSALPPRRERDWLLPDRGTAPPVLLPVLLTMRPAAPSACEQRVTKGRAEKA